ncbi:MAG: integrase, partial [Proteobacteria bacterium]|nr:integrase [Pseudomonadota bacterium]
MTRTNQPSNRKIDLPHMAFYRAWLQGVDLREATDRYLIEGMDLREAKSTLAWMRETLIRAARRHGRMSYVRLLRIQIPNQARDATPRPALPSLEEFREERDPDNFYAEDELLEIYLAEYPDAAQEAKSPQEQRIERLIQRQIEAINWAEAHVATRPMPSDSVVEWFDRPMAERLIVHGLPTLQMLVLHINARGYRWHAGIRQLGQIQAARVVAWLRQHEASLGEIQAQALTPTRAIVAAEQVRPASTDIMPLESFLVPTQLDGVQGDNRHLGKPRIEAVNDYQAINSWLNAVSRNDNTRRSYRREAERLLLWAILERGKALSSLSVDDAAAHQDWLYALGRTPEQHWHWKIPQDKWLGPRNTARWSPDWRPYEGALSLRSQQQSYVILKSLCEWLTKMR